MSLSDEGRRLARIRALITLQGDAEKRDQAEKFKDHPAVMQNLLDPGRYQMYGTLTAVLSDGAEVPTGVRDFGFSGPKAGLGAIVHRYQGPKLIDDPDEQNRLLRETYHVGRSDIIDSVNRMLGRDPGLHHHPYLAWGNLVTALAQVGVVVDERELIDTPLDLALSDEVRVEIRIGRLC